MVTASAAILSQLLAARHSCRAFLPTPVPHGGLDALFGLAQRTASLGNVQPWQMTVLGGGAYP